MKRWRCGVFRGNEEMRDWRGLLAFGQQFKRFLSVSGGLLIGITMRMSLRSPFWQTGNVAVISLAPLNDDAVFQFDGLPLAFLSLSSASRKSCS